MKSFTSYLVIKDCFCESYINFNFLFKFLFYSIGWKQIFKWTSTTNNLAIYCDWLYNNIISERTHVAVAVLTISRSSSGLEGEWWGYTEGTTSWLPVNNNKMLTTNQPPCKQLCKQQCKQQQTTNKTPCKQQRKQCKQQQTTGLPVYNNVNNKILSKK